MKTICLIIAIGLSGLYGCGSGGHEHGTTPVTLNNGVKWAANPETTKGIQNMSELIDTYVSSNSGDHAKLSDDLSKEFDSILQQCTMSGEAHDQLHNYLMPLKEKIDKLAEDGSNAKIKDIQSYLDDYSTYFQ